MIIRSQDKKAIVNLGNIDSITIHEGNNGIFAYNGCLESEILIGEYSTEEKAIKVLDMIEECYVNCNCQYVRNKAFQMPQDSEV